MQEKSTERDSHSRTDSLKHVAEAVTTGLSSSSDSADEGATITANESTNLALIPKPSSHPKDPLTWSIWRKIRMLVLICFAGFVGNTAALAGQLAYPVQAPTYGVTAGALSYSVSAAIAGLAAGALFFIPLQNLFGRWSIIFWSLLGQLACAVWSARMTGKNDYIDFIVSRLLSGLFGSVPSAVGGSIIIDIFYLHQRGRAFICYEVAVLLGATAGATFSGFISGTTSWTICFWWTVPLTAVTAIAVLVLGEDTSFDREAEQPPQAIPDNFMASRIALFFPGTASVPKPTAKTISRSFMAPIRIGLSPVTLICGLFTLITNGWNLLNNVLSPIFLQTPIEEGGYGLSAVQNGSFQFSVWVSIIVAQIIGLLIHDRMPLWICRRFYKGVWRSEYRLWVTVFTVIGTPIGMGIAGAALQYHYNYIVYAWGYFIVSLSVLMTVPVITNYVAECFPGYGAECTLLLTFYRLAWGVAIPFFINDWIAAVDVGWVFGTAAFITLACWGLIQAILWKGPQLRALSLLKSEIPVEDGQTLFFQKE